jgi:iron complex outermembrane receptor protein
MHRSMEHLDVAAMVSFGGDNESMRDVSRLAAHHRRGGVLVVLVAAGLQGTSLRPAHAQTAPAPAAQGTSENITVRAAKRLLQEKNSPSAVTELGTAQISQLGVSGSVATLLRQAPSVYVYQQGIGDNEPVLSVRGTRGLETAQTLDGVPMQDLLNGGAATYLENIIGGHFNLDQISSVSVYPGVAYPDRSTFGTIGGTIAYNTIRPSDDRHVDVFGSVGSFGTYNEGFAADTGRMDGVLGSGDNAPKAMLKYSNLQTNGFIDYTSTRYNNTDFAFDKPYDDGGSDFQATILYNTGNGYTLPEPVPLPYLQQNGMFSNYPTSALFQHESADYFTAILKDDTYINDVFSAGVTAFYLFSDTALNSYGNPTIFAPDGEPGSQTVGGASPFSSSPAGYGEGGYYGIGGVFYNPIAYPATRQTAGCPASVVAEWAAAGSPNPCGFNSQYEQTHNDTYGIQPRLTITPPEVFGIANTIHVGALVAKETQPATPSYLGIGPVVAATPQNASWNTVINSANGFDGGYQRSIYQLYAQDKIDVLDNTLHITPGVTLEGTDSSYLGSEIFGGTPSAALRNNPYCISVGGCFFGSFKAHKWDREVLPFFNIAYDLDKILPAAKGVSLYASTGNSALFAPVTDFGPNLVGKPPNASIVHLYEGGVKYNTANLTISADYFYQKVDRDFGYFSYEFGPDVGQAFYTNNGQREFKGFEASAIWQVSPDWQLFGNVSHTLAHYLVTSFGYATIQEDQFGVVVKGSPVTGVPDWLSTFGADWQHSSLLRDGDHFNARFEGQYTGHQATSYDLNGTQNVGVIPGLEAPGTYNYYTGTAGSTTYNPNGGISPFAIFNLDLTYVMPVTFLGPVKRLTFDVNGHNIFNTHYFQYFFSQYQPTVCGNFTSGPFKGLPKSEYGGCTPAFNDGTPGEPAAVTFSVTARF